MKKKRVTSKIVSGEGEATKVTSRSRRSIIQKCLGWLRSKEVYQELVWGGHKIRVSLNQPAHGPAVTTKRRSYISFPGRSRTQISALDIPI